MAKGDTFDRTSDPDVASSTTPEDLLDVSVEATDDAEPTDDVDSALEAQQREQLQSQLSELDVPGDAPGAGADPSGGLLSSPLGGLEDRLHQDPLVSGIDTEVRADEEEPGPRYGKDAISQTTSGGGGSATTAGVGYGIPTTGEGEVTNSPASSYFGQLQGYAQYEREMTEKADEAHQQRRGSGDDTDGGDTQTGGGGLPVATEFTSQDGSHTTVYENGEIVTTYPDGTVVHNYENDDGSVTTITDKPDGTQITQTTRFNPDGSETTTTTTTLPDGTKTTETEVTPPPGPHAGEEEGEPADSKEQEGEPEDAPPSTESSPDPDSETTPMPAELRVHLDQSLADLRAHQQAGGGGDGVTDPVEGDSTAFGAGAVTGVAIDPKLRYLVDPPDPDFETTGHGHDLDERPAGSGDVDPPPDAATATHTTGPEERDTTHDLTGTEPPSGEATDTAQDDADSNPFAIDEIEVPPDLPEPALTDGLEV